jgi:UDP:flavonoid glycosyltransferase YjiC (YdhE family)
MRVVILQNMLSTYNDGMTPPLNSVLVPGNDSARAIGNAWKKQYAQRSMNDLRERLKYAGRSRLSTIRWAFRQNGLPDTHRIRTDKVFHVGFDNVPEWIAAPAAFDFPERQLLPFQRHLDTLADLERVEDLPPAYQTVIDRIGQERQSNPYIKLIYVSLGTAQQAQKEGAEERFFNRLIDMARTQPNWRLILAVRSELVNDFLNCPPTVFVFGRVPQLHVLQRADVFITHGGLNSVLEAILLHVPMLVYPLNTKWDLPGYAARVVAHGVGLMGDLVRDDTTKIIGRVNQLLDDTAVKDNLVRLSQKLTGTLGAFQIVAMLPLHNYMVRYAF